MSRRAKIVCTLGPATGSLDQITALVEAGMDVARLNFSHGKHADHETAYRLVREASDKVGRAVAILADLQGPKIRLGTFADGPVTWATGSRVCVTVEDVAGTAERVSTTYKDLANDVRVGDRLLVDDGKLALTVVEVDGPDVWCLVLEGGQVSNNKGLSLPGVAVSVPALSEKDAEDLRFALSLGVDFIALSFVRHARDVELVREIMRQEDIEVPVIAKLEKPEAVENLEAIVEAFDGVMVARGDLGVELPLEQVPLVQKRAVQVARERNKPVIVATQMLESMISASRPTRAEASDVANAVLDGADAVMLSGETSVGKFPVVAVKTMERIIDAVESDAVRVPELLVPPRQRSGAIVRAAKDIGEALDVAALAAFTLTGKTAHILAALHTRLPILAFTTDPAVRSRLALSWGVETFLVPEVTHTDDMVGQVDFSLLSIGRLKEGDKVVIVAGSPPNTAGSTNLVRVHEVGTEA
ncbi:MULTISPECIES: pyruvate kinase [unclassified Modestobacter]|uniref:pyruvate kinase n=1 Tax=unclassified Modestobacter TaxID=2643866 RepID=UPI0022AA78A0|nr:MULTISPECIES: pyruvate kinase [unclassified Modestobacter]MCZ2812907.1 pyruvate kinase [Modestobacter sp. VKM Ac-2979]MCZ2843064.1 pyruvate kinase [Modestobacter sp. VKM Ac-2980]MCZ2847671.1 pyruvate kinase [Modestobacter sp. VKM Ac-2978]